jgi:ribulose-bisphosphate carboxylase large chain
MMEQRIRARYSIDTTVPPALAARVIAGEQSTGTFTRIPGETDELRQRHGARVESVTEAGHATHEVEISWPLSNLGPSLPNLLATSNGRRRSRSKRPLDYRER